MPYLQNGAYFFLSKIAHMETKKETFHMILPLLYPTPIYQDSDSCNNEHGFEGRRPLKSNQLKLDFHIKSACLLASSKWSTDSASSKHIGHALTITIFLCKLSMVKNQNTHNKPFRNKIAPKKEIHPKVRIQSVAILTGGISLRVIALIKEAT